MNWEVWMNEPWAQCVAGLLVLSLVALVAQFLVERVLVRAVHVMTRRSVWEWDDILFEQRVLHRLAQATPSLVVQFGLRFVPALPAGLEMVLLNVALATTGLFCLLAVSALLNGVQEIYARTEHARTRSIKGFVQLAKIAVFTLGGIFIVSTLIDRSPLILLSGLGAMSAVLLLVFKDTILSLVASVQLSTNDMLSVGDWIEMPQVGADGSVVDIALHTVKVQNWDMTITTIPTWRLISESFRNWRGMQQSGGRRIKRTLRLDAGGVRFLDETDLARLRDIRLLAPYLDGKSEELARSNSALGHAVPPANLRRLTNIGTFRAYAQAYLDAHPDIHHDMTCMVRLQEPQPEGIPIEVYCFTATTVWAQYERIQGDVFDHLLAILPEFGLSVYQSPSGNDLRAALCPSSHAGTASSRPA